MNQLQRFCRYCGQPNTIRFKEPIFDEYTGGQKGIVWEVQCPSSGYDMYFERHTDTIGVTYIKEEHKQKKVCTCNDC